MASPECSPLPREAGGDDLDRPGSCCNSSLLAWLVAIVQDAVERRKWSKPLASLPLQFRHPGILAPFGTSCFGERFWCLSPPMVLPGGQRT
jgi:hypothetical protein